MICPRGASRFPGMICASPNGRIPSPARVGCGSTQLRDIISKTREAPPTRMLPRRALVSDELSAGAERLGVSFVPIHKDFGADVVGVDLQGGISKHHIPLVQDALDRFLLLRFRGQDVSPADETQLVRCISRDEESFDKNEIMNSFKPTIPNNPQLWVQHDNVVDDDYHGLTIRPKPRGSLRKVKRRWHTDGGFMRNAPRYTSMHMRIAPAVGGSTLFASTVKAYDDLTEDQKAVANKLRVRYYSPKLSTKLMMTLEAEDIPSDSGVGQQDPAMIEKMLGACLEEGDAFDREEVPFVVEEEGSGVRSIIVHGSFFHSFEGMSAEASQALLEELLVPAIAPENVWAADWKAGDIVVWKNTQILHAAAPWGEYGDEPRMFHHVMWEANPLKTVE